MMTAMSTTKETRAKDAMTPTAQMPRWRSARTGPLEFFKRLAEDGKLYTKPEFYEYFGTLHEWNMAGESEVVVNTTNEVIAPTPVRRPLEQIDEAQEEEAQTALLQQQPGCEILKNAHEGVQDGEWPELAKKLHKKVTPDEAEIIITLRTQLASAIDELQERSTQQAMAKTQMQALQAAYRRSQDEKAKSEPPHSHYLCQGKNVTADEVKFINLRVQLDRAAYKRSQDEKVKLEALHAQQVKKAIEQEREKAYQLLRIQQLQTESELQEVMDKYERREEALRAALETTPMVERLVDEHERAVEDPVDMDLEQEEACIICWVRPKTHVLIPCGHMLMCGECSKDYHPSTVRQGQKCQDQCPYCKTEVSLPSMRCRK